jgi:transposase InsO family protein
MEKRWAKSKKKAARKAEASKDVLSTSTAWHIVKKAHVSLGRDTAYLDSGASHHMVSNRGAFSSYTKSKSKIELADCTSTISPGFGNVHVKTENGGTLKLECLHVPNLVGNLISLGRLWKKGCDLVRTTPLTAVLSREGETLFQVKLNKQDVLLIKLQIIKGKSFQSTCLLSRSQADIKALHRRAGHPSKESLKKMYDLPDFTINCEACSLSKSHRLPFSSSLPKSSHCLEFVHFDLSGWINPPTSEGFEYYFKITDQFSSYKFVYLLQKKSEAFEHFKTFYTAVTTLHSWPIKHITTDGGGEFNSNEFKEFLREKGVTSNITAPYTPQQNPVAERGNRTTTEKAWALLKQSNLPHHLWGYAVQAAVFLENVTPTRKNDWISGYKLWFKRPTLGFVLSVVALSSISQNPSGIQNLLTRRRKES